MSSAYYRHQFKNGEAYSVDLDLKDSSGAIDTTNWTGASSIQTLDKTLPVDALGVPIAFAVTFPTLGTVRFALSPTQTAALTPRRYLYDAKLLDASGNPAYYLDGDAIVRESYTP